MRFKNIVSFPTVIALAIVFAVGCAKQKNNEKVDPVLESYRLIDEQRTDEAVELLEEALSKEPNNAQYKAVLASAYAHKAGIKIQTLIPILKQADNLKKAEEKAAKTAEADAKKAELAKNEAGNAGKPSKPMTFGGEVNQSVHNVGTLFRKFSAFSEVYAAIPVVTKQDSIYLLHAVYLLKDIGPTIKPEDALYKAILEVVLFKFILADELLGEVVGANTKPDDKCVINLAQVNASVIKLGRLLVEIYADLGVANPKQSEDTKKMMERTADAVSNVTIATTAVTVLDEAASLLLKHSAIQNGFGKIIQCGGS